ncbi:c-type cytochrome [Occallatibacter savannae]|uniref:c-type cytochrome n=1 Tax=Occallatibacter savannae TaxID=1002691 RepID=UPI000D692AA0|nr:cytochrome c [Occallatibacter savannae]
MISRVLLFPIFSLGLTVATALPAYAAPAKPDEHVKAGATLFSDKGCTYCHGSVGQGAKKGPALTDIWKDKTWTDEKLTSQILNGGQKMPPFQDSVTDDEVKDLIAWLRAKNKPAPPAAPPQDSAPISGPQ